MNAAIAIVVAVGGGWVARHWLIPWLPRSPYWLSPAVTAGVIALLVIVVLGVLPGLRSRRER